MVGAPVGWCYRRCSGGLRRCSGGLVLPPAPGRSSPSLGGRLFLVASMLLFLHQHARARSDFREAPRQEKSLSTSGYKSGFFGGCRIVISDLAWGKSDARGASGIHCRRLRKLTFPPRSSNSVCASGVLQRQLRELQFPPLRHCLRPCASRRSRPPDRKTNGRLGCNEAEGFLRRGSVSSLGRAAKVQAMSYARASNPDFGDLQNRNYPRRRLAGRRQKDIPPRLCGSVVRGREARRRGRVPSSLDSDHIAGEPPASLERAQPSAGGLHRHSRMCALRHSPAACAAQQDVAAVRTRDCVLGPRVRVLAAVSQGPAPRGGPHRIGPVVLGHWVQFSATAYSGARRLGVRQGARVEGGCLIAAPGLLAWL